MARKGVSLLTSLKEEVAQAAEKTEDLILFDEMLPTKPLTAQQESFVRYYVDDGMSLSGAARKAGFSNGTMVMKGAAVRRAVELRREEYAAASRVSKNRVVDGMLESISSVSSRRDPGAPRLQNPHPPLRFRFAQPRSTQYFVLGTQMLAALACSSPLARREPSTSYFVLGTECFAPSSHVRRMNWVLGAGC